MAFRVPRSSSKYRTYQEVTLRRWKSDPSSKEKVRLKCTFRFVFINSTAVLRIFFQSPCKNLVLICFLNDSRHSLLWLVSIAVYLAG